MAHPLPPPPSSGVSPPVAGVVVPVSSARLARRRLAQLVHQFGTASVSTDKTRPASSRRTADSQVYGVVRCPCFRPPVPPPMTPTMVRQLRRQLQLEEEEQPGPQQPGSQLAVVAPNQPHPETQTASTPPSKKAAPAPTRACHSCGLLLGVACFSGKQLKRGGKRVCAACIYERERPTEEESDADSDEASSGGSWDLDGDGSDDGSDSGVCTCASELDDDGDDDDDDWSVHDPRADIMAVYWSYYDSLSDVHAYEAARKRKERKSAENEQEQREEEDSEDSAEHASDHALAWLREKDALTSKSANLTEETQKLKTLAASAQAPEAGTDLTLKIALKSQQRHLQAVVDERQALEGRLSKLDQRLSSFLPRYRPHKKATKATNFPPDSDSEVEADADGQGHDDAKKTDREESKASPRAPARVRHEQA